MKEVDRDEYECYMRAMVDATRDFLDAWEHKRADWPAKRLRLRKAVGEAEVGRRNHFLKQNKRPKPWQRRRSH